MHKLGDLVLNAMVDKVVHPDRMKAMLKDLKAQIKEANGSQNEHLLSLQKELAELEQGKNGCMKRSRKVSCLWIAHCKNAPKSSRRAANRN